VRQVAQASGEAETLGRVRRVLLAGNLVQGTAAMSVVWLLRERLAVWLFGDATHATEVGLVGVAILLALLSGSQTALLQGLRRIGDLGRVTVYGALAGTLGGLALVWAFGEKALIGIVLLQPLAACLVAAHYVRRLPRAPPAALPPRAAWATWKPMVQLGAAFMLGGLVTALTLLLVRARITDHLGLEAAGQFAAAWGITMTYVGFLLSAMGMDYYPRLSQVIDDRAAANRLMNEQAQLSLAIGGPVLLLLIGLAPLLIVALYSAEFGQAVTLLQWQTAGNMLKIVCWSLGFAFGAAARSRTFLLVQVNFNLVYLALVWPGLVPLGLEITGIAFLAAYAVHFAVLNLLARRMLGFRWEALSLRLMAVHVPLALGLLALALARPLAGGIAALVLAAATAVVGLRIVLGKIGPDRRTARLLRLYAAFGWPLRGMP
jgi:PST family polysaccharide transporter